MRYLVTSTRTPTQLTLGFDERGLLCELLIGDIPDEAGLKWVLKHLPLHEHEVHQVFSASFLKVAKLHVTFDDFWKRYAYKEGKKDAMTAWSRLSDASRQLAFDYVQRYKDACRRDQRHVMYPATYLLAERWNDHA